jgi:hypothetical protein
MNELVALANREKIQVMEEFEEFKFKERLHGN